MRVLYLKSWLSKLCVNLRNNVGHECLSLQGNYWRPEYKIFAKRSFALPSTCTYGAHQHPTNCGVWLTNLTLMTVGSQGYRNTEHLWRQLSSKNGSEFSSRFPLQEIYASQCIRLILHQVCAATRTWAPCQAEGKRYPLRRRSRFHS
jgi:hypothetical protein